MAEYPSPKPVSLPDQPFKNRYFSRTDQWKKKANEKLKSKCVSFWIVGLVTVTLSAGCVASGKQAQIEEQVPPAVDTIDAVEAEQATPAMEEAYRIHTIRWSGETISIIAGWYTGDIQNWRALAEANPDIDPNKVHVGDENTCS